MLRAVADAVGGCADDARAPDGTGIVSVRGPGSGTDTAPGPRALPATGGTAALLGAALLAAALLVRSRGRLLATGARLE